MVVIQSALIKQPPVYNDQVLMVPKVVVIHGLNCTTENIIN